MAGYRKIYGNSATRYRAGVSRFGGIDLSPNRFLVSSDHAIAELNYVFDGSDVSKRKGYRQILAFPKVAYYALGFDKNPMDQYTSEEISALKLPFRENGQKVNGIWDFVGEDGKSHVVAHVGKLLFVIDAEDETASPLSLAPVATLEGSAYPTWEFLDMRSMAFVGNRRLWFLGGNKFVVLRFPPDGSGVFPQAVEDSPDTYVPTTSVSITYEGAKASGRTTLDPVNLMTRWRKNLLLSGVGKNSDATEGSKYFEYVLDGPLYPVDREGISNNHNEALKTMASFRMTIEHRGRK